MMQQTEAAATRPLAREHGSLLAAAEKQCLIWMAGRLPRWTHPDHLTVLALVAMMLAGACFALARAWPVALLAAIGCLVLHWFGDSLDGTLARVRGRERPRYGYYVDHVADSFGALFLFGGLAASGYISPAVALALLIGYLLLAINSYLAAYSVGVFELAFWKIGPTELRILLAAGVFAAWRQPAVSAFGSSWLFLDLAGGGGVLAMAFALLCAVARNTRKLYRLGV